MKNKNNVLSIIILLVVLTSLYILHDFVSKIAQGIPGTVFVYVILILAYGYTRACWRCRILKRIKRKELEKLTEENRLLQAQIESPSQNLK